MNAPKFINLAVKSALALAFSAGVVQAAPLESYLKAGNNVIEDDSNEYVFRQTQTGGFQLITSGAIQNGDLLVQMLDYPIINGVSIDSKGSELVGIAVNKINNLQTSYSFDPDSLGPLPAYTATGFNMVAATAAEWLGLTGINIGVSGYGSLFDTSNLISLVYYSSGTNNLDVYTDSLSATGIGHITDGTLVMGLGLTDASDYITAWNTPLDVADFAPNGPEVPGVTQYGQFSYQTSVLYENLGGEVVSDVDGSGTNLVTDRLRIAAVIDDTQASFNYVPEPGSLALLGMGLLGLGFSSRKRRI